MNPLEAAAVRAQVLDEAVQAIEALDKRPIHPNGVRDSGWYAGRDEALRCVLRLRRANG